MTLRTIRNLMLSMAFLLSASVSQAAIVGTAHDLSANGWSGGEICIVCHTPHNADTTVADAPLWNHEVTTQTFVLYSSPTLDTTTLGQPDGVSKLCLSCHDGTVAIDSFGGGTGTNFIGGPANVGIDLSDDHPISFDYDATLVTADGELEDPATALSGVAGGGTIADDLLFAGSMECSSCHDVHGNGNANLLVVSNASSALCLTCHIK